jgi:hypothetical protein
VFLASPGDVTPERVAALEVIQKLNYDPGLNYQMRLDPIAWDSLGSRRPMLATKTPQQAIAETLPRPSACDIVIVILWSRMGTELDVAAHGLKDDGTPYQSGTEWEYLDALRGAATNGTGRPVVLVYRRIEKVTVDLDDPDRAEKGRQYDRVKHFFERFRSDAGAQRRGFNSHANPEEFARFLENDLRYCLNEMLVSVARPSVATGPTVPKLKLWRGSPFPGLRAFNPDDAPIFFGRRYETDALLKRTLTLPFVAVVGASGSGKSSLVGAGLIPQLETLAENPTWMLPRWSQEVRQWIGLRFTPGELSEDPFTALAARLPTLSETPRDVAKRFLSDPSTIAADFARLAGTAAKPQPVLVFIDQFEELFTVVRKEYRSAFATLLAAIAKCGHVHVIVTIRSDFYHRSVEYPVLAELLERGTFPLSIPRREAWLEMIERPAERAGLTFEAGLVGRILDDMGDEPGGLALMAYTLDELYRSRGVERRLSANTYEALGGVQGAIGRRADTVFAALKVSDPQRSFEDVFSHLLEVDDRGTATRQRVRQNGLAQTADTHALVDAFTDARLLTTDRDGSDAIVQVAHEALLRTWPKLANWIEERQDDLRLRRRVEIAAHDWAQNDRRDDYLWSQERLEPVYRMRERLRVEFSPLLNAFTRPEVDRLLEEFQRDGIPEYRQHSIIDRIAALGDIGGPAMLKAFDIASRGTSRRHGFRHLDLSHDENVVTVHMHGFFRKHATKLVPDLLALLSSNDAGQRASTVHALGMMEATISETQLIDFGILPEWPRSQPNPVALGDSRIVSALLPMTSDSEAIVRFATVYVLGLMADPRAIPVVIPLLDDTNDDIRADAAVVLGYFGAFEAMPALSEAGRGDRDRGVRRAAAMALGAMGQQVAMPLLLCSLQETEEWWKRERIIKLLGQYDDVTVRDALQTIAADNREEKHAREVVLSTLRNLGKPIQRDDSIRRS